MQRAQLTQLLHAYASQPVLLVWLAGIVMALLHLRKARGPALLALCSLTALLLLRVVDVFVYQYAFPRFRMESGWPTVKVAIALSRYSVVMAVLQAVAWVPLLPAIFGWRSAAERPPSAGRR